MKRFGIILAIVGLIALIAGNFFYGSTVNAVDSSGSSIITTGMGGGWTFKLPVFAGGALFFLGFVFWAASRTDNQHHDHLI
jgi:Na+-transporting NADH:ubiquinone oxidoreductase subunit NqrD